MFSLHTPCNSLFPCTADVKLHVNQLERAVLLREDASHWTIFTTGNALIKNLGYDWPELTRQQNTRPMGGGDFSVPPSSSGALWQLASANKPGSAQGG